MRAARRAAATEGSQSARSPGARPVPGPLAGVLSRSSSGRSARSAMVADRRRDYPGRALLTSSPASGGAIMSAPGPGLAERLALQIHQAHHERLAQQRRARDAEQRRSAIESLALVL
jgi:hypothetical protein